MATWEGSTALASRPSFEMESLTSVTSVETTSTTSRRFSILIRTLNIVDLGVAHRSPLKGLLCLSGEGRSPQGVWSSYRWAERDRTRLPPRPPVGVRSNFPRPRDRVAPGRGGLGSHLL